MQKYKYKFSPLALTFMAIGFIVAISVIIFNVIKLVNVKVYDKTPSYVLSVCIACLFIIFELTLLFFSYYTITDKSINLRISFICTGEKLSEIVGIVHFTNINKLAIYFSDEEYMYIVIDKKGFDAFVDELRSKSPKIEFRSKEF